MVKRLANIALFAFNRPNHLSQTLKALAACPESLESKITIYCDGPRGSSDLDLIEEVYKIASEAKGFKSVSVIKRPKNLGLAGSILDGLTSQFLEDDRIIVLEDDIVVSKYFLRYMNEGLEMYAQDKLVASIHGYLYPIDEMLPETFFLRGSDCWGWATWSRAWEFFCEDGSYLLSELRRQKLINDFNKNRAYPFSRMLKDQIVGRNNSWAIRWHASCFLNNMLTLYPARSLVNNIGNDSSGTHCKSTETHNAKLSSTPIDLKRIALVESQVGKNAVERFYRGIHGSFLDRVVKKLKIFAHKVLHGFN